MKQKIVLIDKRLHATNKDHSFKIKKMVNMIGGDNIKIGRYISEFEAIHFIQNNVQVEIVEK